MVLLFWRPSWRRGSPYSYYYHHHHKNYHHPSWSPWRIPTTTPRTTTIGRKSSSSLVNNNNNNLIHWRTDSSLQEYSSITTSRIIGGTFPRVQLSPSPSSSSSTLLSKRSYSYLSSTPKRGEHQSSASSFSSQHRNIMTISYITDIEGDKEYLNRYVKQSKVLMFSKRIPSSSSSSSSTTYNNNNNNLNGNDNLPYSFPYDHCIDFIPIDVDDDDDNIHNTTMLVHGGDIWDKGGSDLYVIRQLLDLKRRYPNRVILILGNRDVNKLRMLQELGLTPPQPSSSSSSSSSPPPSTEANTSGCGSTPHHPGLWWLQGTGRIGDSESSTTTTAIPTTPAERLQWILRDTMGSPDAFRFRKAELAWERQQVQQQQERQKYLPKNTSSIPVQGDEISDDQVVESYRTSCHPLGEIGQYVSQGQLAARVGPVLFLHGAIPLTKHVLDTRQSKDDNVWEDLTFAMPWRINQSHSTDHPPPRTVHEWIDALNDFGQSCAQGWKNDIAALEVEQQQQQQRKESSDGSTNTKHYDHSSQDTDSSPNVNHDIWATKGGYDFGPPYSALIQYGMSRTPDLKFNPTVIYNSWFTNGMPNQFHSLSSNNNNNNNIKDDASCEYLQLTKEFLEASQLRLIMSGHQPQGDLPSPIRLDCIKKVNSNGISHTNKESIPTEIDIKSENAKTTTTTTGWIICCDTSYSGDTKWFQWPPTSTETSTTEGKESHHSRQNLGRGNVCSFRGEVAVTEVLIELDLEKDDDLLSVRYHGVLSDGSAFETDNILVDAANDEKEEDVKQQCYPDTFPLPVVGQVAPPLWVPPPDQSPHPGGQWWTKAVLGDGSYVFQAAEGFDRWNFIVSPSSFPSKK